MEDSTMADTIECIEYALVSTLPEEWDPFKSEKVLVELAIPPTIYKMLEVTAFHSKTNITEVQSAFLTDMLTGYIRYKLQDILRRNIDIDSRVEYLRSKLSKEKK